jgi:ankyrin repeat protein
MRAAATGKAETVRLLLAAGADPAARIGTDATPPTGRATAWRQAPRRSSP